MNTHESTEKENLPVGTKVYYFRHSMAKYGYYKEKLESDNPRGTIDPEEQNESDLTDDPKRDGAAFARKQAEKFFKTKDPEKDIFFIASSDQRRALDTAAIYADVAEELGFSVVEHKKTGTEIAKTVGEDRVRSLESLSLNRGDVLSDSVFYPPEQLPDINWPTVDPEFKERWDKARKEVLKYNQSVENKGERRPSWGDNAFHCAEKVKSLLPDVETPTELQRHFAKMLRLARFAQMKGGEHVNVLAFGHENAPAGALQEATESHTLGNCEAFEVTNDKPVRVVLPE